MKFTKGEIFFLTAIFLFGIGVMFTIMRYLFPIQNPIRITVPTLQTQKQWQIESIDTMKFSRDTSRQYLTDPNFNTEAEKQMGAIASTGANYVAIDTPYDDEFLPVLQVWVRIAREHRLHVWFRGNFSGWEGWFGYDQIDKQTHTDKTKQFILNNSSLFENGDIFTSCPECENGANLKTGIYSDVVAYRKFLISEYKTEGDAFIQINKKVKYGYFSMNADVAQAVMDKPTTHALGEIVVIDHYVRTPEGLANEVASIAQQSGGSVVLGEFGAPIPDINGLMTENQQRDWLGSSLQLLSGVNSLIGLNYWVNKGGSTALWRDDGSAKPAVDVLKRYYQ